MAFQVASESFSDAIGAGLSAGVETAMDAVGDYRGIAAYQLQEGPVHGAASAGLGGVADRLRKAYPETAETARRIGLDPLLPTLDPQQ